MMGGVGIGGLAWSPHFWLLILCPACWPVWWVPGQVFARPWGGRWVAQHRRVAPPSPYVCFSLTFGRSWFWGSRCIPHVHPFCLCAILPFRSSREAVLWETSPSGFRGGLSCLCPMPFWGVPDSIGLCLLGVTGLCQTLCFHFSTVFLQRLMRVQVTGRERAWSQVSGVGRWSSRAAVSRCRRAEAEWPRLSLQASDLRS